MNIEILNKNGIDIAVISSDEAVITDTQSALDLVMSVKYETGAERIALPKEGIQLGQKPVTKEEAIQKLARAQ